MVTLESVIAATATHTGVPVDVIKNSRIRTARASYARHLAQFIALRATCYSYKQVADAFKQRSHSSVFHAALKIGGRIKAQDQATKDDFIAINKLLGR